MSGNTPSPSGANVAQARRALSGAGGRVGRSLLGAAAAGLVVAAVDAGYAGVLGGEGALAAFAGSAGLVAPVALGLGALVGLGASFLFPGPVPSPSTFARALRERATGRPADVAAFVPLAVLGGLFWATLAAQLCRALLALDAAPGLVGAAVALGASAAGLLVALAVLAATPPLRVALATASEEHPGFVDPARTGAAALGLSSLLFAYGVATGSVSGDGGFFGIWGIFKREELDLRAPAMLVAVALAAFFAPLLLARLRAPLAALLALSTLLLTARASGSLGERPALASSLERDAPLGKIALRALRRATDRDGDGASARFGGGDCNDARADVGPLGTEIPDNGLDEDCSGSDLSAAALAKAAPSPEEKAASEAAKSKLPEDMSVVLVTIDTLRHDLGFTGYPRPVTPNLDALAAKSTVFERAYALASYTGKSVGPMLIGKYGSETHRNWGHFNKFGEEDTFVAERLQKSGARTMAVHGHRYFGKWGGLERGFDVLDLEAAPPEGAPWDKDDTATSKTISDRAISLLEDPSNTKGRFFLWAHYLDPHADYLPHDDVPSFGKSQRDLYDGEVAFTDKHIGRVLDAIAASPFAKRTAIIVTSDHGEAFGEHKMYRHGFEVWEALVRVPLLVYVPGAEPKRVSARRSTIDVAPTILDLMSVPLPPPASDENPNDFLSGDSLLPDVFSPPGKAPEPRDVLVDMPAGPYNDARRAFISGDLKLIVSNNVKFELYDLAADPGETKDLWGDPEVKARILPKYEVFKARMREIKVTGKRK